MVPGSEVAGFFVSVQQLSFIEQGGGVGWWGRGLGGHGRKGGYPRAGSVEAKQFCPGSWVQPFLKQLARGFSSHGGPRLS